MQKNSTFDNVVFTHDVLEGTAYEAGRLQGDMLKNDPTRCKNVTSLPPFLDPLSRDDAQKAMVMFERYCPGINDEIRGTADVLGVSAEKVAFYGGTRKPTGGCSHLAVLPSVVENGHLYMGRNQDDHPEGVDLRLCTTRVRKKARHIGFSDMIFGRIDGINEYGLCVTTSLGAPGAESEEHGLPYFVVVRILLDRCQTVDEALDVLADLPIAWFSNFIVADRQGNAALIEVACSHRAIKRIDQSTDDQFLYSTNHYTLPSMRMCTPRRMRQSVLRHSVLESRILHALPHITKKTLKDILSESMPDGVCCHHYSGWLGTLWSLIIDVTTGNVDVCIGAPSQQGSTWRTFDMTEPVGSTEYRVDLPDEPAGVDIWEHVPPEIAT